MVHALQQRRIWLFHVVVLQRTIKKCTKMHNAREQPSYCSLCLAFAWKGDPVLWNYPNTSTWLKKHVRWHATACETPKNRASSRTKLISLFVHMYTGQNDLGLPGTGVEVLFINRNQRATAHSIYRCSDRLWLVNNSIERLRSNLGLIGGNFIKRQNHWFL